MTRHITLVAVSLLALAVLGTPARVEAQGATILAQPTGPQIDGPRLAAFWQELQARNAAALDSFWAEIKGTAQLVEPNLADTTKVRLTFVHKARANTKAVFLAAGGGIGGLPPSTLNWSGSPSFVDPLKQLALLPGTNLWYRTERIPINAQFAYQFGVLTESATDPNYVDDPLNATPLRNTAEGYGSGIELPNAPPVPWIQRDPNVPQGKLVHQKMKSQILKTTRTFTIYTPPGYDPNGNAYGLLVEFDGEVYADPQGEAAPIILDNLIAKQQIVPLVAVMVDTQFVATRSQDLGNSPTFADLVAEELVPWVRQSYHLSTDPACTIISGSSLGGLMASYSGLRHSEVFGNVLSQSGAYWPW